MLSIQEFEVHDLSLNENRLKLKDLVVCDIQFCWFYYGEITTFD